MCLITISGTEVKSRSRSEELDFYCELPDQIDCTEAVHGYISTKDCQTAPSLSERPLQAVKNKAGKESRFISREIGSID